MTETVLWHLRCRCSEVGSGECTRLRAHWPFAPSYEVSYATCFAVLCFMTLFRNVWIAFVDLLAEVFAIVDGGCIPVLNSVLLMVLSLLLPMSTNCGPTLRALVRGLEAMNMCLPLLVSVTREKWLRLTNSLTETAVFLFEASRVYFSVILCGILGRLGNM